MKMLLCSVGKANETYIVAGVHEFTKRMSRYHQVDWSLIPPPKNASALTELELKKQEAKSILGILQKDDVLVLLDERGKMLSSPEMADYVEKKTGNSKRLVFLIGGAFGVDESIFEKADLVWSLSRLVFPHMLVRLILAEQLYRAFTINKGEKYHHV